MISASHVARRLAKASAATADRLRPPARGVVVLLYHRVGGGSGLELDLPASLFEEQIVELAAAGRVISLDAALAAPSPDVPPGPEPDPVVVTFDDGTADFADVAMPILERHGVPATLYLATAFIEEARPFGACGAPLSWAALADAMTTGLVTIGSHTHTHALLDRLPAGEVAPELDRSIQLIGDRLGARPAHFGYPKALAGTPEAAREVAHRFRSAALAGTRPNRYGFSDPQRLARSPVQAADGMRWFRHKLAGGMALEDGLRTALNRRRYRGRVT